jgi:hypothetical protein
MARKKIREYDSKRLLKAHILRLKGLKLPLNVAQVPDRLPEEHDRASRHARSAWICLNVTPVMIW